MDNDRSIQLLETDVSHVAFTADGQYLVGGGRKEVGIWRAQDGTRVKTVETETINCLAVSNDRKWIAAGTWGFKALVWDAKTFEKVFEHEENDIINGVDFAPDSTRLVIASNNHTATVWNTATWSRPPLGLGHKDAPAVIAAKYSPQGDRIATATSHSVHFWDTENGDLLRSISVQVASCRNTGLLWSNYYLFVVSGDKIKKFEASTGLLVSEFSVSSPNYLSCIALPRHGDYIVYSADHSVSFWSTSTRAQLTCIKKNQRIRALALSPDDKFLAVGGEHGKITIQRLRSIHSDLRYSFQEPDIQTGVPSQVLDLWKGDRLKDAEESLNKQASDSRDRNHHVLSCRALVRTRLKKWDDAIRDAKESIEIRSSVIGYLAKSVALAGKGEKDEACRACDIAFEHYHSTHVSFLLLIKAIIVFISNEHNGAISRVDDLIATFHLHPVCSVVQAYMHCLIGDSLMRSGDYDGATQSFVRALVRFNNWHNYVGGPLLVISLIFGWNFDNLGTMIRQGLHEAFRNAGCTKQAGKSLLDLSSTFGEGDYPSFAKCISNFTQRCLSSHDGEETSLEAAHLHVGDRSLITDSTTLIRLLREWAKATLTFRSWKDSMTNTTFLLPRSMIYQALCECLEASHVIDAVECLQEMVCESARETHTDDEQICRQIEANGLEYCLEAELQEERDGRAKWISDFRYRCCAKLEKLGDSAMIAQKYDEAISHYSTALSLAIDPSKPALLVKRSEAHLAKKSWQDALNDADEIIRFDSSSLPGHEKRFAAIHSANKHTEMLGAQKALLSKMEESPDPDVRSRLDRCKKTREIISKAIREFPPVVINTASGRLCDKLQQAAAFESTPFFAELVLSTTTHIDEARIRQEVTEFYQYATFSHTWEENEPLFRQVRGIVVYELDKSPTHDKLQMFCKIARDAGYKWAWSDTCCIDQGDQIVLHEAIISMFRWYKGSALTIVFLRGVRSPGNLVRSIWNSRAWTFQEYHASKVVRFYTEDWKLYRDINKPNHKDAPEIISEMAEATGIPVPTLRALQPGLPDIRVKLRLASERKTSRYEDEAYSLLGMFSVVLTVAYGERDKALGRLLAQLISSSGDTSILAWTGKSGSFNSCLPSCISVFKELPITHVPTIKGHEFDAKLAALPSSLHPALVMQLHEKLNRLPLPEFTGQRMKLPCFMFKLRSMVASGKNVFRAQVDALGAVELQTTRELCISDSDSIYVVHPWIDILLDRRRGGSVETTAPEPADTPPPSADVHSNIIPALRSSSLPSWLRRPAVSDYDLVQGRKVVARLMQPFGALLFTPDSGNVVIYRRVATENLIRVQVLEEMTSAALNQLIACAEVVQVL